VRISAEAPETVALARAVAVGGVVPVGVAFLLELLLQAMSAKAASMRASAAVGALRMIIAVSV
jgi:hypothetical protein